MGPSCRAEASLGLRAMRLLLRPFQRSSLLARPVASPPRQVPSGAGEATPLGPGAQSIPGAAAPPAATVGFRFSVLALSCQLARLNSGEEATLRHFC